MEQQELKDRTHFTREERSELWQVAAARRRENKTWPEISKELGVSVATLQNWKHYEAKKARVNGGHVLPKVETLSVPEAETNGVFVFYGDPGAVADLVRRMK